MGGLFVELSRAAFVVPFIKQIVELSAGKQNRRGLIRRQDLVNQWGSVEPAKTKVSVGKQLLAFETLLHGRYFRKLSILLTRKVDQFRP